MTHRFATALVILPPLGLGASIVVATLIGVSVDVTTLPERTDDRR